MTDLRATYRLQLGPDMTFADVRDLVPYLQRLGVSHVYLSPSLKAREGSTHGYDVVDPTTVSESLGGEAGLRELAATGIGIILDIVPNHMGTGDENRWWKDEELRRKFFDVDPRTGFYRRFFDIDDLAGIRVEDPEVFHTTHDKALQLVAEGIVDGLRVDHPDGLANPAEYLQRLREAGAQHVWVEKILHTGEAMRDWPVEGTVGYEFLDDVCALFVDPAGEAALTALYEEVGGDTRSFEEVAAEAQLEQATGTFTREVDRLRALIDLPGIAEALAALPIYRTYVEPTTGRIEDADREAIAAAGMPEELARVLTLESDGGVAPEVRDEFVSRFQQTSPPVTAKGVEDTAFYRYVRLLALNEVGGDPARFGISVESFHAANRERAERFPHNLLVTQTHDTKRSGDVRARIGALSEVAEEWAALVHQLRDVTEELRHGGAPDGNEQLLIFQTLLGAYPITGERLDAYLEKALREAKRNTNWVEQNTEWEEAVKGYARALLEHRPFLDLFLPFRDRMMAAGNRAALGQLLLKLTVPGLPDIYQGDEMEDLSLVDPDNRRPVDWDVRRRALDDVEDGGTVHERAVKLDVIRRALALRNRRPEAFGADGGYEALDAGADVCAFTRGGGAIATLVRVRTVDAGEPGTVRGLAGRWRDVLGDRELELEDETPLAGLLDARGLALLERLG